MVNQGLLDWINEQKTKGYGQKQLRNSLLQQGNPPQEVNEAINISFGQKDQTNNSPKEHKKMKPIWIVLIVLGAIFLLFIVPVLIGISWVVTRNVIEDGASQIQGASHDCLAVEVRPMKVLNPSSGVYEITIQRSAGGDTIGGIKLVLEDGTGNMNYIHDVPGNINPLATEKIIVSSIDFEAEEVMTVIYFLDDSGNEILCAPSSSLSF